MNFSSKTMIKKPSVLALLIFFAGLATGCFTETPKKPDAEAKTVSQEKTDAEKSSDRKPAVSERQLPEPLPCTSCNGRGICGSCGGRGDGIGGKVCSFCDGKGVCWSCKGSGKRG